MKRILVIEDNTALRENIAEILELADYTVETAANGKLGIAAARKHQPDLILCDIMMPELDGYSVLHVLTRDAQTARIPFIFLTAKTERESLRKGMAMGADDYITKPFEDTELLEAIEARITRISGLQAATGTSLSDFLEGDVDHAFDALRSSCRKRSVSKKSGIYQVGEPATFLYFLKSGRVKQVRMDAFGKELAVRIVEPGEFFGHLELLGDIPRLDAAIAMEESEVEVISGEVFQELVQGNRNVAVHFIKWLSSRVADHEERLLKLAYQPVRERTADVLLFLFDKSQEEDGLPTLHVSRDDLASMVGTATESLIRVLSSFKQEAFIGTKGRSIQLLDKAGLTAQILG